MFSSVNDRRFPYGTKPPLYSGAGASSRHDLGDTGNKFFTPDKNPSNGLH